MPEPCLTSLRIPAVGISLTPAERDGLTPAPPRGDRRPPVQTPPARARRVSPPVRNLPRHSGY
ncbi:hypothetical protein ACIHCQ_35790 [Streptomyces sp. NPDC052236]|uniref:hypothetical protein n=1 Tax=Streptomyces sp. NPDC052236 TaxID=3365686 RepID=UPI0037CF6519